MLVWLFQIQFFFQKKEKIFKKKPPTGYILDKLLKKNFISLETLICRKVLLIKFHFNLILIIL